MRRLVLLLSALLATSCNDADQLTAPAPGAALLPLGSPVFVRLTPDGFAAAPKSASFWAVKGEQRGVALRYRDSNQVFMHFIVPANALSRRPDGSAFAQGDSIQISVTLADDGTLAFDFQPSGLKFDDAQPAVLRINYARANRDFDADGDVDLFDTLAGTNASIWRRDVPLLPWLKLPTLHLFGDVVTADVDHFSGFGMATN